MESDVAYRKRKLDARASKSPLDSGVGLPFGFCGPAQPFRLLQGGLVEPSDFLNLPKRLLGLRGDFLFGELFIIELNNFPNGTHTIAQVFSSSQDLLNDDGRASDGFHDHKLSALHALGDNYFAFAGEQRH